MKVNKNMKKGLLISLGIFVFSILFLLAYIYLPKLNGEIIKEIIISSGKLGPIILIIGTIAEVIFAPIPGQIFGFLGGYVYGILEGNLYSMIGLIIGSLIIFSFARFLGRPFIEKIIGHKKVEKFDNMISTKGEVALFLLYLLPAFPDDIISYIAGLSNIKIRRLIVIAILGRLPTFLVLNMAGAGLNLESYSFWILIGGIIIVSLVGLKYRDKIEISLGKLIERIKTRNKIGKSRKESVPVEVDGE